MAVLVLIPSKLPKLEYNFLKSQITNIFMTIDFSVPVFC